MLKRRRNKIAVSTVIGVILIIAITVVLAGVLYVFASHLIKGSSFSSYGTDEIAFYTTTPPILCGVNILENVSIQYASPGLQIVDVGFKIVNAYGRPFINPTGVWNSYFIVNYFAPNGKYMGQYNIGGLNTAGPGTWQYGGNPIEPNNACGSLYLSTPYDGDHPFVAGGFLEIEWYNGTGAPPQENFYGYNLVAIEIGSVPVTGSIPLQ
ncbi:MAG: type IV pilin [Thermoplasmata archaeon]